MVPHIINYAKWDISVSLFEWHRIGKFNLVFHSSSESNIPIMFRKDVVEGFDLL
jgi:hypothetical protein